MTEIRPKPLRIHAQSEMVARPSFQSAPEELGSDSTCSATEDGAAVLYLVYRAAEALTAAEDRAIDIEARAQTLARRAMEEVKLAEQRVHAVDAERQAIESKLSEANTRVQECEIALEKSESRSAVAEAKLTAAEHRAREAELRANAARAALVRIEEAIRTHLLRPDQPYSIKSRAAA
jgi:DNA repair exonuclease SbcCD ATPase subunit